MKCSICTREMILENIEERKFYSCPERLDGLQGYWGSMVIEVITVLEEDYLKLFNLCGK